MQFALYKNLSSRNLKGWTERYRKGYLYETFIIPLDIGEVIFMNLNGSLSKTKRSYFTQLNFFFGGGGAHNFGALGGPES